MINLLIALLLVTWSFCDAGYGQSLYCLLTHSYSLTYSCTYLLAHSFTHRLIIYLFAHSLAVELTYSLTH